MLSWQQEVAPCAQRWCTINSSVLPVPGAVTQTSILLPGDKSVKNYSEEIQHSSSKAQHTLTWCHCATWIVSPRRAESSCHPRAQQHLPRRTLGSTRPAHTAGRRSLGREGTRFPPGHLLAWTPNQHASLHQPLVSGSRRQGSYLSWAKANEPWGRDAPAQGLVCKWGA